MGRRGPGAKMAAGNEFLTLPPLTHLRWRGPAAIRTRPRIARSRSVRLSVQDSRLSRGKGGFDSRTERQNILTMDPPWCRRPVCVRTRAAPDALTPIQPDSSLQTCAENGPRTALTFCPAEILPGWLLRGGG